MGAYKLLQRSNGDYERVVMSELLVPDVPNTYGDIYTREAIKDFAYRYAMSDYVIDIDHDQENVRDKKLSVVEYFIARPGDPDFIEGSLVIGMKVHDDEVWERIVSGELNGYSFEAEAFITEVAIQNLRERQIVGVTEPDLNDGHTHEYLVILNALNHPVSGGTGVTDGHSHKITRHTVTNKAISVFGAGEHSHRYQVIVPDKEEDHADSE